MRLNKGDKMVKLKISALFLLIFLLNGCESTTKPEDNNDSITVSGSIENIKNITLTDNMKVYVFWGVYSGQPDYSYVWGRGSIDKNNSTFKIDLTDKPPSKALNNNVLGVGMIILVDDSGLQNGILPVDYPKEKLIGIAGWYGIIYKADESLDLKIKWVKKFVKGYKVGIGVEGERIFDSFVPTNENSIKLIIDDLGKIKIVNWS